MKRRRIYFLVIVCIAAAIFISSAAISISVVRHLILFKSVVVLWGLLTIGLQLPFIIVPIDRGKTLGLLIDSMPQNFLHLLVAMNITNIFILILSPLLFWAPEGQVYGIIPFLLLGLLCVTVRRSAYRIKERKLTIPLPDVAESWQPFTILHLSDVHAGPFMRADRLKHIVDGLNERGGFDLCVITGDVVNHSSKDLKWVLPILEGIKAPLGTFASIGNHEYIDDEDLIKEIYSKSSIQLIFESSILISDGRHNIRLIGVDYPFSEYKIAAEEVRRCLGVSYRYSPQIKGELQVLLSHHPEGFRGARDAGVQLTLSGHTHGGQVIVLGKNLVSPFVHYKRGVYRKADKYLFVNSGLGNWLPFRINCPCEYAIIKVVGAKPETAATAGATEAPLATAPKG